jgi:hypothetical protein
MTDYNLTIRYVASLAAIVFLIVNGDISTELLIGLITGILFPTTQAARVINNAKQFMATPREPIPKQ